MTSPSGGALSDDPGFEGLFRREFPMLFRLAHLLGADDPEDVAAEAFARLQPRWAAIADRSRAGGYLRVTVVNLCRSRGRRNIVAGRFAATQAEPEPAVSAELAALERISDTDLLVALGALSPRHREALVLRYWLDLSESQMAEAMECSPGTVKSHVSRGLKALRAALGSESDRNGGSR